MNTIGRATRDGWLAAIVRESRRINVYTPPGYDEAKGARYPVLPTAGRG